MSGGVLVVVRERELLVVQPMGREAERIIGKVRGKGVSGVVENVYCG